MQLNLPEHTFKIKQTSNGMVIFDVLRARYVALTPEEWVRQNFVAFLIHHKGFKPALMANEMTLELNGNRRRCDTLVADRQGSPLVIVEYKAPDVTVTQAVFDQIVRYNMSLHAEYLVVSNGMNHYCCKIDYVNNTYHFIPQIPDYHKLIAPLN